METVNTKGDPVVRHSKYNEYQISEMLQRRQQMLIEFRKARKYGQADRTDN